MSEIETIWSRDGTRWRLVYKLFPVPLMRFGGRWWCGDGRGRGVLVEMTTMLGEVWYCRPEHHLVVRQGQGAYATYIEPDKREEAIAEAVAA